MEFAVFSGFISFNFSDAASVSLASLPTSCDDPSHVLSLSLRLQNAYRAAEKQMETLHIAASGGKSTRVFSYMNYNVSFIPSIHSL